MGSLDLMLRRVDAMPGPKRNPRKGNPRAKTRSNSVTSLSISNLQHQMVALLAQGLHPQECNRCVTSCVYFSIVHSRRLNPPIT
jgi:hypothetical protein